MAHFSTLFLVAILVHNANAVLDDFPDCLTVSDRGVGSDVLDWVANCIEGDWEKVTGVDTFPEYPGGYRFLGDCPDTYMAPTKFGPVGILESVAWIIKSGDEVVGLCEESAEDYDDSGPFDLRQCDGLSHDGKPAKYWNLAVDELNPAPGCKKDCDEGFVYAPDPDMTFTSDCSRASSHLVVQGRTNWGGWGSAPDSYCQSDDDNQAAYDSSKHDRDIGVGCCSMDGTTGYRPDCNAHPATYQDAEDLCSSTVINGESLRLCTQLEMLYGITERTGCGYDGAYQWTSDVCDVGTDVAASSNVYGSIEGNGSVEESRSFDDFIPMVLGAAAGVVMIVCIVAFVVAMRRKKVTEEALTEMSDVVHVPDESAVSVDGTVTVTVS